MARSEVMAPVRPRDRFAEGIRACDDAAHPRLDESRAAAGALRPLDLIEKRGIERCADLEQERDGVEVTRFDQVIDRPTIRSDAVRLRPPTSNT